MTRSKPIRYRCLDCGQEFDAGPGPVTSATPHELPCGRQVNGACPACGSLYVGRLQWFVVACHPRADAAVADKLEAEGHAVLFLHYLIAPKKSKNLSRKQRQEGKVGGEKTRRPVMPGYVFVGMVPPLDFYSISSLREVAAVLANERGPAELDVREIDRLRAGAGKGGVVEVEAPRPGRRLLLKAGSVVRILSGPFQGFEGPVEADDGGRFVKVRTTMFGHKRPVDVPFAGVEVVAEAA